MPLRWQPTASGVGGPLWGSYSSCPPWNSTHLEIGKTKEKPHGRLQCRCIIQLQNTRRVFELSTWYWGAYTLFATSRLGKWSQPPSWWKQLSWDGRLLTKLSAEIARQCGLFLYPPTMSRTNFGFQVNWWKRLRRWSPRVPTQRRCEQCHAQSRGRCYQPKIQQDGWDWTS